jgi:glucosamine 6-phosphate synthetase-like amidotransferase/phosphosugar isomerase protein
MKLLRRLGVRLQHWGGEYLSLLMLFIEYTSNAVYLEDGEMAVIRLHKSMSVRKLKMIQWLLLIFKS